MQAIKFSSSSPRQQMPGETTRSRAREKLSASFTHSTWVWVQVWNPYTAFSVEECRGIGKSLLRLLTGPGRGGPFSLEIKQDSSCRGDLASAS